MSKPEWLVRGAEVIVYAEYLPRVILTTAVKEVGQWFFTTVADLPGYGQPGKFTIKTLTDSSTHRYSVLPADSVAGQEIIRQSTRQQAIEDADIAVWKWERDENNKKLRDAAVAALQAIEYES